MKRAAAVGLTFALLLAAGQAGLAQGTSDGDRGDNAEKIKAVA